MSVPFVWFHHNGLASKEAKAFYESMFAWKSSGGPGGMTMLAGDSGPPVPASLAVASVPTSSASLMTAC